MEKSKASKLPLNFLLIMQTLSVLFYTFYVGLNEGWDVFGTVFTNISSLTWSGQFTLDFSCYLLLSGLWIMWRNTYSASSVGFGIVASILGIIVFAPYLLYLMYLEKGNIPRVLLGDRMP